MKLSTPQKTVADCQKRFRTLVTGRRFGKTTLAIRELCYHARTPDQTCWYVAPSYRQSKQIVWEQLKARLFKLNWIKRANEAELTITLKNNSKICLRGADNADSLRGVGINFLVMDEVASIPQEAWTEVLRPTLSDTQGKALFCGTPKGIGNWLYDLYQNNDENWEGFQFTTLDGGFVPQEEIESARKDLDKVTFTQEYEGTFQTYSGVIFYGFDRKENVQDFTFDKPQSIIHVGIDMNVNPMSAVIFVIKDGKVLVIDEVEMYGSNTDELANEIVSRFPNTKIFAYPDPACRQRKTSAGGRTDLSILQNAGFICKVPTRHQAIRDGVNAMNSKLCNGANERGIIIHPRCKKIINCLERQIYKPGTSQPDKESGWDHMNDALRYAISFLFPITRDFTTEQTTSWGVKVA